MELTDFLENAVVGLHKVDGNGIVSWANRAELDLLGYEPAEYIGRPIADFVVQPGQAAALLHASEPARRCATSTCRCAARTARPRM